MQAARYVVAATLVLGLAACGQDETTTSAEAESAQPVDLAGRTFESAQVSGITLADGTAVTLSFEDDGISASAGCNTMSGGANWDDGTLEIAGELATTMMACPDGLQEQEDWLGALLTSSPAIALDGDTLTLATTPPAWSSRNAPTCRWTERCGSSRSSCRRVRLARWLPGSRA